MRHKEGEQNCRYFMTCHNKKPLLHRFMEQKEENSLKIEVNTMQ